MMASFPTLSSLAAQLTASAAMHTRPPVCCVGLGRQYEGALHLHAAHGCRRDRRFAARARWARPSRTQQPAGRGGSAQHYRCVVVCLHPSTFSKIIG
ncbi:hypothetical protein EDB86DRAFT_2954074 [Lactarius hatsudake]|nr:hypothetical protein EDB86DRAFT_2954074 [Lactarius hatsudake]